MKMLIFSKFGHVLGMVHEQVRHDRDTYIEYRCENVRGYHSAYTTALLAGEDPATIRQNLCDDFLFAAKYGFMGTAYTKNDRYKNIPFILDEGEFDYQSIMMYPSNAYSGPECQGTIDNLDKCVLVALDRVKGVVRSKSFMHTNLDPSQGDVEFVRRYYPFVEEGAVEAEPEPEPRRGSLAEAMPSGGGEVKGEEGVEVRSNGESVVRVHRVEVFEGHVRFL